VLTGHGDASWVDDSATQRSSQGYTFSLGSGSVSWRSAGSSLVLSCEAEIYTGAIAAQELRWLTYLLTDLGEQPRSPPQRGQLRLAYVATRANTADVFTKALPPACFAFLDWSCDRFFSPTLPMGLGGKQGSRGGVRGLGAMGEPQGVARGAAGAMGGPQGAARWAAGAARRAAGPARGAAEATGGSVGGARGAAGAARGQQGQCVGLQRRCEGC
ncbi:unnamed protein product, partial [Closterium sp. NIES-53]